MLRCTLKAYENMYQVRFLSNQINKRFYISQIIPETKTILLDPWFVTGLSDAEGCFTMSLVKNNNTKICWAMKLSFQIGLDNKDN